jgi:hypothetical protein
MLTSAEFFESFNEAGFLKPASWTPLAGGGPYIANVRLRAPDVAILDGNVIASDREIEYVTEQLPALKEGEAITVDGIAYVVRKPPMKRLDGTVSVAELKKA